MVHTVLFIFMDRHIGLGVFATFWLYLVHTGLGVFRDRHIGLDVFATFRFYLVHTGLGIFRDRHIRVLRFLGNVSDFYAHFIFEILTSKY